MGDLRLISWNVNGIRAVQKKGLLDWLSKDAPDIFSAQETKAHPDQLSADLMDFSDYHKYFSSADRKGYSGVCTFSRVEPGEVEYGLGIERFDREGRTLILHYDDFTLFNIYYPNGKKDRERLQYKLDFYDAFLEKAEMIRKEGRNIVVCGDVNTAHHDIDLARPRENENSSGFLPVERKWIDRFLSSGYVDTFRMFNGGGENYSWWDYKTRARDRNIGWRIDYFFVSDGFREKVMEAFILDEVQGSDHCPIGITLAL